MSVQSEIDRIQTAVTNAYTVIANKGGTVPSQKVSGNLASAIDSIPAGTTVLRSEGWFVEGETINCGFKPDLVSVMIPEAGEDGWFHPAAAFHETGMDELLLQAEVMEGFFYFGLVRTSTGFTVDFISFYDWEWNYEDYDYDKQEFQFTAVKYT